MFQHIKSAVQERFTQLVAMGALFQTDIDRDVIWETYLSSFPEAQRQGNNCNCCKSFLRQFGGIVDWT